MVANVCQKRLTKYDEEKIKPMTNCENEELSTGHKYIYNILEYLLLSIVLKFVIFF